MLRATRVEKPVLQLGCCRCWVGLDDLCELLTLISLCGDVAIGAFQTNFFANMSISDEFACCPLAIGKNTFDMPHVVHWELRHLDYAALAQRRGTRRFGESTWIERSWSRLNFPMVTERLGGRSVKLVIWVQGCSRIFEHARRRKACFSNWGWPRAAVSTMQLFHIFQLPSRKLEIQCMQFK